MKKIVTIWKKSKIESWNSKKWIFFNIPENKFKKLLKPNRISVQVNFNLIQIILVNVIFFLFLVLKIQSLTYSPIGPARRFPVDAGSILKKKKQKNINSWPTKQPLAGRNNKKINQPLFNHKTCYNVKTTMWAYK